MVSRALTVLSLGLASAAPAPGQILEGALSGLDFGRTVAEARESLASDCAALEIDGPREPRLPMSRSTETRAVCRGYAAVSSGTDAVFSFSDDSLTLVELRGGGVADSLADRATGERFELESLVGWPESGLILDPARDVAWLVAPSGFHPQAYLWESPHLHPTPEPTVESAAKPTELVFGAPFHAVHEALAPRCRWTRVKPIDPPSLPGDPTTQTQIDCFGLSYAGGPRKVEAVFADERLALVWILTGAAEEDRVREALVEAYGPADLVTDAIERFGEGVVLRKDKPEVLFLSEEMVEPFTAWLSELDE